MAGTALFGVSVACAQALLEEIVRQKRIRIGVPIDLPPFGSLGSDQQPQGLDIDIAKLIAAKLGVKAQLVPVPSGQRVLWLQERRVDLVVSTLGKTAEREKLIDFGNDYSSFYLMVFGPRSIAVSAPADLKGKSVAVTRGSVEDGELTKLAVADVDIKRFDDNAATLAAYAHRKTQLLAAGITAATALGIRHPQLEVEIKFTLKESRNYIGVPKGETKLRDKVNGILEQAKNDGELRRLTAKWFSHAGMKS